MLSLPLIFWSTLTTLTTIAMFYVLINYEVQRWKDKQRLREGIYIRRVNQAEALIMIFTPAFPCLSFVAHIYSPDSINTGTEILVLSLSAMFISFLRYVHVAYVKLSPEGIEQRVWSANPTVYPIGAIDSVTYYETVDVEDQDMVGFYTKSGKQIAAFGPTTHNNYRILAIVRFRIENEHWPDMDNPDDVAQVDALDKRGMTISYFRDLEKVTGLADVDM
ncbi:hypothetical protein [uncultured Rothia sp.]|uniref:hypothetical protein n=1 Tax=uncultured Rothia sp. TaxID=316088 RepID=UPI0028D39430|nr:hypothetical protein [uncultured Rothia sp.]